MNMIHKLPGSEFCKNVLDTKLDFNEFVSDLQEKLKSMRIRNTQSRGG